MDDERAVVRKSRLPLPGGTGKLALPGTQFRAPTLRRQLVIPQTSPQPRVTTTLMPGRLLIAAPAGSKIDTAEPMVSQTARKPMIDIRVWLRVAL